MKTTASQFLKILLLSFLAQPSHADVYSNPIGPVDGPAAAVSGQFLGARFNLSTPTTLVSVEGEFQNMTGTFFAALVPLASMTSLPVGNPSAGIPFNPGEVLAYQTFEVDLGTPPEIVTIPFPIDLSAGVYGVVFGSFLFGTTGYPGAYGGMPAHATVPGSSSFFWSSSPWRWQNSSLVPGQEFNIMITTVPEPSGAVLMTLGLAGLPLLRRLRRVSS